MQFDNSLKQELIKKNVWNEHCPVSLHRIKLLNIDYINFSGEECSGQIMVFDVVADNVVKIFAKLKQIKFPIAKIKLINEYNANDEESMADNNSSSFCCRVIKDTDLYSIHSYGMAIDVNPLQNPIIYNDQNPHLVLPVGGEEYLDRSSISPGMITRDVVEIFKIHGFTVWGGAWKKPVDYHHFNVPRNVCERLAAMGYDEGVAFWEDYLNSKIKAGEF